MSDGELIYLIGVVAAFTIFAVTLAIVSYGKHLPPAGTFETKNRPSGPSH